MVGVKPRGVWVAEQLKASLNEISKIEVELVFVTAEIQDDFEKEQPSIANNCIILVDDILNSGTTMMLAASRLALKRPSRLLTACLVDRKHRKFPIQSDFTGLSLATTIQ